MVSADNCTRDASADTMIRMRITSFLQSFLAIVVGILVGAILSTVTDAAIEIAGFVPRVADQMAHGSPTWFLIVAIAYRTIFTVLSCYLGARLAPSNPMRHAVVLGVIALLANLAGTIAMWKHGQNWYPVILTLLALPSAWAGGWLRMEQLHKTRSRSRR